VVAFFRWYSGVDTDTALVELAGYHRYRTHPCHNGVFVIPRLKVLEVRNIASGLDSDAKVGLEAVVHIGVKGQLFSKKICTPGA
jgi:hypothetical protein